jgi:hypothetical protein
MFLRTSRYLFAILIFSIQGALLASILYALLLVVLMFAIPAFAREAGIIGTTFHVFGAAFVSGAVAFFASIVSRRVLGWDFKKAEPYLFVALAALLANSVAAKLVGIGIGPLHAVIYLASIAAIFFGARIYRNTWRKLNELVRAKTTE